MLMLAFVPVRLMVALVPEMLMFGLTPSEPVGSRLIGGFGWFPGLYGGYKLNALLGPWSVIWIVAELEELAAIDHCQKACGAVIII